MSYYLEPDSSIRDKVKVVLDLSNYATFYRRTCYMLEMLIHLI